jgi:hypothetical protein
MVHNVKLTGLAQANLLTINKQRCIGQAILTRPDLMINIISIKTLQKSAIFVKSKMGCLNTSG